MLIWEYVKNFFANSLSDLCSLVVCDFPRPDLLFSSMRHLARVLLAFLLVAALPMFAQAPAASPAAAAPAMKDWFIRLIPPRPTFDKDMTEAEHKLMEQHFVRWKDLFGWSFAWRHRPLLAGRPFVPGGSITLKKVGELRLLRPL